MSKRLTPDYGGCDALYYVRELFENHPDSWVTGRMRDALWKVADDVQDGAPDAGVVSHLCTHIAALLREMM